MEKESMVNQCRALIMIGHNQRDDSVKAGYMAHSILALSHLCWKKYKWDLFNISIVFHRLHSRHLLKGLVASKRKIHPHDASNMLLLSKEHKRKVMLLYHTVTVNRCCQARKMATSIIKPTVWHVCYKSLWQMCLWGITVFSFSLSQKKIR